MNVLGRATWEWKSIDPKVAYKVRQIKFITLKLNKIMQAVRLSKEPIATQLKQIIVKYKHIFLKDYQRFDENGWTWKPNKNQINQAKFVWTNKKRESYVKNGEGRVATYRRRRKRDESSTIGAEENLAMQKGGKEGYKAPNSTGFKWRGDFFHASRRLSTAAQWEGGDLGFIDKHLDNFSIPWRLK